MRINSRSRFYEFKSLTIILNDKVVDDYVFRADDKEGWVEIFQTGPDGKFVLDDYFDPIVDRFYGKVEIKGTRKNPQRKEVYEQA